MSRDEDAFRWEGDDDLDRPTPDDDRSDADDAAEPGASAVVERPARGALGWLALALAVAATAGWIVVVVANPVQQPSLLGLVMYQLGELLALVAPLLWWWCVDRLATARRGLWWLVGVVVTAPWPLVAGVLA